MFNIGVLVPQSTFLPNLNRDLPSACKMGVQGFDNKVSLFFEPGGYNESADSLKEKIQGMIMRHNIHAVLCPLNSGLIDSIDQLCKTEEIVLIVNTMGEDVIFEPASSESLFVNSYQLWQSAWLTGYYAAKLDYKNLASLSARHDAGYGATLALAVGAEAGEADIKFAQVTHFDSADEDCTEQLVELDKMQPDAVIAHHSSKEAISLLRDIEKTEFKSPLLTLPPFVEDITLNQFGPRIEGIQTVSPFKMDTDQYRHFAKEFDAQTGRVAHPHIVMAYESLRMVLEALETAENTSFLSLIDALKKVTISGPRGTVGFNPDAKKTFSTCYVREVSRNESGRLYNKTIDQFDVPELCHEHYVLAQKNTEKQGWLNPYLIA